MTAGVDGPEWWMPLGLCAPRPEQRHSPLLWFPNNGAGVAAAQRVCLDCPVQIECLEYALERRIDHGVWGGVSERARRQILKDRGVSEPGAAAPSEQ